MTKPLRLRPLAVRRPQAAQICGISDRLFGALVASGRAPRGLRLARCRVWLVSDLRRWLESGAPCREQFEAMRKEAAQ
jgi:predicted DNA-binding transcriptional regulator AlpA